jgi:hypothetical protein
MTPTLRLRHRRGRALTGNVLDYWIRFDGRPLALVV